MQLAGWHLRKDGDHRVWGRMGSQRGNLGRGWTSVHLTFLLFLEAFSKNPSWAKGPSLVLTQHPYHLSHLLRLLVYMVPPAPNWKELLRRCKTGFGSEKRDARLNCTGVKTLVDSTNLPLKDFGDKRLQEIHTITCTTWMPITSLSGNRRRFPISAVCFHSSSGLSAHQPMSALCCPLLFFPKWVAPRPLQSPAASANRTSRGKGKPSFKMLGSHFLVRRGRTPGSM